MIKSVTTVCEFEDVALWQKFKIKTDEFIKLPEPKVPFMINIIKQHTGYVSGGKEDFSPNAYDLKAKEYVHLDDKEECVIEEIH